MRNSIIKYLGLLLIALTFIQCDSNIENGKFDLNVPNQGSIVKNQQFTIDTKKDTVIIGENGTTIFFPKNCFKNSKGEIISDKIQFELREAFSLSEILFSNLSTTSNGKLLETDGMIYINATSNKEQLTINQENPIYIEIPTDNKKPEMMVYEGIRLKDGSINWINPLEIENFIIPVDLDLLNFYPKGFEQEVENGLPYRNHSKITERLTDSLFYSFSVSSFSDFQYESKNLDFNEPYYQTDGDINPIEWKLSKRKLKNNLYEITISASIEKGWMLFDNNEESDGPIDLSISFDSNPNIKLQDGINKPNLKSRYYLPFDKKLNFYTNNVIFSQIIETQYEPKNLKVNLSYMACNESICIPPTLKTLNFGEEATNCGVDPAIIRVIKSSQFQNTLISTREFETRLQSIYKTCNNEILELYINNLEKDLYQIDSLAYQKLSIPKLKEIFQGFFKQRLTRLEKQNKSVLALKNFYDKELKKIKKELKINRKNALKILKGKDEQAQQLIEDYKMLLQKREKHRMEKYGFLSTRTGWFNIDIGIEPKDWESKKLEIFVSSSEKLKNVYSYIIYPSLKSIYRLNTTDSKTFYFGNSSKREMLAPKKENAIAVSIAFDGNEMFFALNEFELSQTEKIDLKLKIESKEKIEETLKPYNTFNNENSIKQDLVFVKALAEEKKRQEKLKEENELMGSLWRIVNPCCASDSIKI